MPEKKEIKKMLTQSEILKFDGTSLLSKINIPTLVIGSKQDQIFKISVPIEMARRIKKSELHLLHGTHAIIQTNPRKISREILFFIKEHFP